MPSQLIPMGGRAAYLLIVDELQERRSIRGRPVESWRQYDTAVTRAQWLAHGGAPCPPTWQPTERRIDVIYEADASSPYGAWMLPARETLSFTIETPPNWAGADQQAQRLMNGDLPRSVLDEVTRRSFAAEEERRALTLGEYAADDWSGEE